MLSDDLLKTAEDLLTASSPRGRPKQAHLRRAVSSVYYALFHCLAKQCADDFIGTARGAERSASAWQQVYRSLNHNTAKDACKLCRKQPYNQSFPQDIQNYADIFIDMQDKRHGADYDPFESFVKDDILVMIDDARRAMETFQTITPKHRKAFSAFILFGKPRR